MLEEQEARHLEQAFNRIFSFPITKLTFKEIQRSVFTVTKENRDKANQVLEAFLTGNSKQEDQDQAFKELADQFSAKVRLARDVLEKGEFISFLSSDLINPTHPLFINQVRRIDGEEFQFLTEPEGIIHLLKHFIGRVEELQRIDKTKAFMKHQSNELKSIRDRLDQLIL